MESEMRDIRRQLIGLNELPNNSQAKADFTEYSVKLKDKEREYRDFCRQTSLTPQNERLRVYEYNRSLSQKAVWANKKALHNKRISVKLPTGDYVPLSEGKKITNKTIIAGKGRKRKIDIIDILVADYGGNAEEWRKMKGFGYVDLDGESYKTEIHWYEEPTIGEVKHKVSTRMGDWIIED